MIIAIEGMDGVGKTTICKILSKRLNYKFIDKPVKYLKGDNTEIEKGDWTIIENIYNKNELIRSLFFLTGNILALDNSKNENVILDRHFASNLFWNSSDKEINLFKEVINLSKYYYSNKVVNIFLFTDKEELRKRLIKRNENDEDINNIELLIENYEKMKNIYKKLDENFIEIDTTGLTIDEVIEKIYYILEGIND